METIFNSGIAFIIWFQGMGGWLAGPMKFFSFLGTEYFFLAFIPLVYWCVDARLGLRLGTILLVSQATNNIFKLGFHGPRPYWYSTQVTAYAAETSFGVPSGHAQVAASLWGMAAALLRNTWVRVLAVLLILLIGLSRIYLGVHFPHDVLIGWAAGGLILWGSLACWDGLAGWAKKKSLGQQVGLALGVSITLLAGWLAAFGSLRGWVLPEAWIENARQAGVSVLPDPVSAEAIITLSALLFGLLAGAAWLDSRGGFNTQGSIRKRLLRLLPGALGVLILYLGLRAVFPDGENLAGYVFRFVRYGLVGFWVFAGAPWLFQKLHLA